MKSLHVNGLIWAFACVSMLHASTITLSGVVISDNQKNITSRHMGFVKEVYVEEGSVVKKGDLLYEIDAKEVDTAKVQVELNIAQAQLNAQMYESQYNNALLNFERHQRLYAKDMVSKFELENLELSASNLKAMMTIAQKQVAQAKQKLQEVNNQYQYLKVRAPNDGVIISKNVKTGEMALPGALALVLSDLSRLMVVADVSQSHLSSLKKGDKVEIVMDSIGYKTQGVVDSIVPQISSMAHTFKIKIAFQASPQVYPGMYVILHFNGLVP